MHAAAARFQAALQRYPNKKQLLYDYPEALIKSGKPAQASAFAETQLLRFPGDGLMHQIAARAYSEQGMRLKQHEHQGEFYAWGGALSLAIGQMELAEQHGVDVDVRDHRVLDREGDVRGLLHEAALRGVCLLGAAILHSHVQVSLSDPNVTRAVVGAGLYLTVLGLFAIGVGGLIRHTAGAISTAIG